MRTLVEQVTRALEREPRVSLSWRPLRVALDRGDLVLEGEVEDVAAKKLALERAGAIPGVDRIIDRLHVEAEHYVPDDALRERVYEALRDEQALSIFRLIPRPLLPKEEPALGPDQKGFISVGVSEGVVTLDGNVTSLAHKRIAGELAWWTMGVRDVVNGLGVEPPEEDSDAEITDAMRLVLEMDPLLHPESIQVQTHDRVVRLSGAVQSAAESKEAERDAWCLFGVNRVDNLLRVVS